MKHFALVTLLLSAVTWAGFWLTPDQQAQRLYQKGDFAAAAATFRDSQWKASALFRNGEFKRAAALYGRRNNADAFFNQGNSLVMLGEYEAAIRCYDKALQKRPEWTEAAENRALAMARAAMLDVEAGDMTGGMLGADDIVFDEQARNSEQTEEVVGGEQLSDQEIQAMWLRRVSTRPADFLRAKFAFQQARREVGE